MKAHTFKAVFAFQDTMDPCFFCVSRSARHTFASWAVANNIKPELLQKMLGHADYSTTANIYEHFDIDQLVDAINVPVANALLTNQETQEKEKP